MKLHNIKKVIAAILVGALIIVNSACNSSSKDYTKTVPSVKEEVSPKISSAAQPEELELPEEFQDKAFTHIEQLCSYGERYAGSEAEDQTAEYISKCFLQYGLEAETEEFSFHAFSAEDVSLMINDAPTKSKLVIFNPYESTTLTGSGVIYHAEKSLSQNLKDKIVIIEDTVNPFQLLSCGATAIVILTPEDYAGIKQEQEMTVKLKVTGRTEELTSRNIIGSVYPKKPTNQEVIISAHWDSYQGQGASDNASGIAVMLELAKYYAQHQDSLSYNLRFVAFGGEELGLIGSRAYINSHREQLENCTILFNIDQVGGDQDIFIEMKEDGPPASKLSSTEAELYAMTGYDGKWIYNQPFTDYANVPEWLRKDINTSCSELNYNFVPAHGMGSDHESFMKYGIPAVNICVSGNEDTHSPKDTLETVNKDSLTIAGRIVASVINRTLNR